MAKFTVTADRFRRATKEQNPVTKEWENVYTRYFKGDKVDMPEKEAERHLKYGNVVRAGEDQPENSVDVTNLAYSASTPQVPHTDDPSVLPAGTSGQTADEGLRDEDVSGDDSTAPEDDAFDDETPYPILQAAARGRSLPATGTKAELLERLRANSTEDE